MNGQAILYSPPGTGKDTARPKTPARMRMEGKHGLIQALLPRSCLEPVQLHL